jgi:hypothetical protein
MEIGSRHRYAIAGLCLLAITTPRLARAQVFKTSVDIVALTVTVTDEKGRSIGGLNASDFAIFEEGVEQRLAVFGSEEVPLDVAPVIDTSSSMRLHKASRARGRSIWRSPVRRNRVTQKPPPPRTRDARHASFT